MDVRRAVNDFAPGDSFAPVGVPGDDITVGPADSDTASPALVPEPAASPTVAGDEPAADAADAAAESPAPAPERRTGGRNVLRRAKASKSNALNPKTENAVATRFTPSCGSLLSLRGH